MITEHLALWGAITGTIGTIAGIVNLWLRFKQHNLDKPKLVCIADFQFYDPSTPTHSLVAINGGKRPITIDKIKYYINPPSWKLKIIKSRSHKLHGFSYIQKTRKLTIEEGQNKAFNIDIPNGLPIHNIYKVSFYDQTNKEWHVKWPRTSKLKKLTSQELIHEREITSDNLTTIMKGWRLGNSYYIELITNSDTESSKNSKKFYRNLTSVQYDNIIATLE
ncbi:hypothetical protein CDPAHKCJ_01714 [Cobetia sp. MB87]|nr:hypothetical protein [Cobetia sp. MB87]